MSSSSSSQFAASYDSTTKIISAAIAALWIAVGVVAGNSIVLGLGALVLLAAYAWSPRGYSVADGALVIHRLIGNVHIPLDAIREARRATPADFDGNIRLFGSGGLFGYYGVFRTSTLGKCTWYVTNRGNSVVIAAGEKTSLVSPDDTEQFLGAIRTYVPVSLAPPVRPFDAAPAPAGNDAWKLLFVLTLVLLAGALVSVVLVFAPGPPTYSLTPTSLKIHDRFYPVTLSPSGVDVVRVRVIDLDADPQWRPVERTNGFANSHYRSGHFRVAGGQEVRLYQAQSRRLVLIPPTGSGTPVLLETRDPEAFVAELKREWSGPLQAHPPV